MPTTTDPAEAILNRTLRPALSVVGTDLLPGIAAVGNVLRPKTLLKLSLRLQPTVEGERAAALMEQVLDADPPYNARVSFSGAHGATGWNAPPTAPWVKQVADAASMTGWIGEGGTTPFMNMLGERFPDAQYLITGVLGPQSNAHGPDEFLHIDAGKRRRRRLRRFAEWESVVGSGVAPRILRWRLATGQRARAASVPSG